ncbi:MAG: glucose-6-phosphate isomerase [Gammaproteobacteria bacterium]|jgi:glucose-6-phosphate isomerase
MTKSNTKHPDRQQVWQQLSAHHEQISDLHMRDMFAHEPMRARKLSIRIDDLLVDYSKHRITEETLSLLFSLADASNIPTAISELFAGVKINTSEDRPALHPVLRAPAGHVLELNGENIVPAIQGQLTRMREFVQRLYAGEIQGASGQAIEKVINIGIGGSDLGPRLVVEALAAYKTGAIEVAFVSNLDPQDLSAVLADSNPETTMIIVASKSFTTLETRTNADAALRWLKQNGCKNLERHIIAVTTNQAAARDFGATDEYIFYFWDWVGGRYSLWSAVGLPIAIAVGMDNFERMLAGAHVIDSHFQTESADRNVPVILALLSLWYNNFFNAESHAVIPYDQSLRLLPEYLSQLVMESNGKSVSRSGRSIDHPTSPILWGTIGTNAQHAFFQMLHQGTHLVPVDFLLPLKSSISQAQQLKMVSNCLAQSEALMLGQQDEGDPNKQFPGNTPSTTLLYSELTPRLLGMLIAIYEHKTFVEAMLWDINPFDQWGVELGKKLAEKLSNDLLDKKASTEEHDASTLLLMTEYLKRNE